jgi:DNA polymerase
MDQRINARGVHIDRAGLEKLKGFIDAAGEQYEAELSELTGGTVTSGSEVAKLIGWLAARGTHTGDLQADTVSAILRDPLLPPDVRRVLELRQYLSMSSIKKIYAIERRLSSDGRLRGLFAYQGGDRTGRWAGRGPQPQNLPSSGPGDTWGPEQVEGVFQAPTWAELAAQYDNPLAAVSGSLRGLFSAAPGHDPGPRSDLFGLQRDRGRRTCRACRRELAPRSIPHARQDLRDVGEQDHRHTL